ncbi:MAG TPA: hypothetical protein VGK37_17220 [Casimicrobiaceae bacterium]|jgi:hypothetical protein
MNKLPTDRYVLERIFRMYESAYPGPKGASERGENDPYVAIDVHAIAKELGCNPELLFGRLYYHLDQKYRYKQDNGPTVSLFELKVGSKRHAVQFPDLASILAGFNQEFRRYVLTLAVSCLSLGLAIASLAISIFKH